MGKKNLKRKQKVEKIKEDQEVVLPLVRRSDEPVLKKVIIHFSIKK